MVGFYPSIFLSFAISPVIALGTPRDKPTNVLARWAAQQAVGGIIQRARSSTSVFYFPSRQTTPPWFWLSWLSA